jgi:hypothetical protein
MSINLTFTEAIHYPDDASGITISTLLSHAGNRVRVQAKVDIGAEVCLFRNEIGRDLGLIVEQGTPKVLYTLTGTLEAFGHSVVLQTGDLVFESLVYFAKYPNLPRNLLGREGWLRKLLLAVSDYENLLYLGAI